MGLARFVRPSTIIELNKKRAKVRPEDGSNDLIINVSELKKITNTIDFNTIELEKTRKKYLRRERDKI